MACDEPVATIDASRRDVVAIRSVGWSPEVFLEPPHWAEYHSHINHALIMLARRFLL